MPTGHTVSVADLEAFLGSRLASVDAGNAMQNLAMVTAMVRAYTRGRGFTDGSPADDVAAVILTATARLMANPEGTITESVGDYSVRHGGFHGFNLVELAVLNTYRRRAA